MEWVVTLIPTLICAVAFQAVALWAFLSKEPVHFWAGSEVKPKEVI